MMSKLATSNRHLSIPQTPLILPEMPIRRLYPPILVVAVPEAVLVEVPEAALEGADPAAAAIAPKEATSFVDFVDVLFLL